MMDYVPGATEPPEGTEQNTIPCDVCGDPVHYTKAHRLEILGVKEKVCDKCCPNCFGGVGRDGKE